MQFSGTMLVVEDVAKSRVFYERVFGLPVIMDFGANITFEGGFSLQDKKVWLYLSGLKDADIKYGGRDMELYFEEGKFDEFVSRLHEMDGIEYLHDVKEMDWGQRSVSFYDPDGHVLEVGEDMATVCRRLFEGGMSKEDIAKQTMYPSEFVEAAIEGKV